MKKLAKGLTSILLIAGIVCAFGSLTSCKSSETMYTTKAKKGKVINRHYKMRGDNLHNKSTYRTF